MGKQNIVTRARIRLRKNEYRTKVDYVMPREPEFDFHDVYETSVSPQFEKEEGWTRHPLCEGIDTRPGKRIFWLLRHGGLWRYGKHPISLESIVVQADEAGYRPAIRLEGYAFAKKHPRTILEEVVTLAPGDRLHPGTSLASCTAFVMHKGLPRIEVLPMEWDWMPVHIIFVRKD